MPECCYQCFGELNQDPTFCNNCSISIPLWLRIEADERGITAVVDNPQRLNNLQLQSNCVYCKVFPGCVDPQASPNDRRARFNQLFGHLERLQELRRLDIYNLNVIDHDSLPNAISGRANSLRKLWFHSTDFVGNYNQLVTALRRLGDDDNQFRSIIFTNALPCAIIPAQQTEFFGAFDAVINALSPFRLQDFIVDLAGRQHGATQINFISNHAIRRLQNYKALRNLCLVNVQINDNDGFVDNPFHDFLNITYLNLSNNHFTNGMGQAFANMLRREDCPLQELYLENVGLPPNHAAAIANALTQNNTLQYLSLAGNQIHNVAYQEFFYALSPRINPASCNISLHYLDLSNNGQNAMDQQVQDGLYTLMTDLAMLERDRQATGVGNAEIGEFRLRCDDPDPVTYDLWNFLEEILRLEMERDSGATLDHTN